MRLAGERGGEGANLSMCSRPRGLYKARVSDLLELAKIARELAAAFRQSPRRHGDRKRRKGHRVWSRGVHGHRPHYAARGRRLRIRGLLETLGGRRRRERRGDTEPRRGGDARWPWNDRSFRKAFAIQAPSQVSDRPPQRSPAPPAPGRSQGHRTAQLRSWSCSLSLSENLASRLLIFSLAEIRYSSN
ncbi:PREDICTED: protein ripply2 isoform X1 [Mandrillus leucophaeus]|uniref:protein ripply2 isoform X1 n=1 Tax=Mandrillus leucophaeus TaxID=9568 RepID=UPI0005F54E4A|nr:PREDICTED: protein ripply2 isoform X1 [Mandrillus leucophaeus]